MQQTSRAPRAGVVWAKGPIALWTIQENMAANTTTLFIEPSIIYSRHIMLVYNIQNILSIIHTF